MKRLSIIFNCLLFTLSVFSQGGNTATGYNALSSNITGYDNTATGAEALTANTTGSSNSAHGRFALYQNVSGNCNTATGAYALKANLSGDCNTANGYGALLQNITGGYNTAVGAWALHTATTGSYNTAIGYCAGAYANYYNTTAIGSETWITGNNQVRIGNTSITSIGGTVGWSNLSDGRTKKNIRQDVPGLAFINKLQPITYHFDLDAADYLLIGDKAKDRLAALSTEAKAAREAKEKRVYTGFIAQDVEQAAQSIGYDFSGVDVDEVGVYALRYSEFVVPLVKAVQELSEQHDVLQDQVNKLTELVNRLLEEESNPSPAPMNISTPNASLEQNFPNPFNQATTIRYALPETYQSASIAVTTVTGSIVRQIPISGSGSGSISIEAGSLPIGTYYYTLYVNNTLADTKKMILTK